MGRKGGATMSTDPTQRPDSDTDKTTNENKKALQVPQLNDPQIESISRVVIAAAGRSEPPIASFRSEAEITARLDRKRLARGHLAIMGGNPRKHRGLLIGAVKAAAGIGIIAAG